MITLPFSMLPGVPRLFSDYCTSEGDASNYFLGHFSDLQAIEAHLDLLARRNVPRERLADILVAQNRDFGGGPRTMEHIHALRDAHTFAVVTGQQVGLFGGPLYTVYKALTAVHAATWLGEQFPSYTFVPVFWLESDDHDLDEAGSAVVAGPGGEARRIVYAENPADGPRSLVPVGSSVFDERITAAVQQLREALPVNDFAPAVLDAVERAYAPGATFTQAFARLLHALLPDAGLVLLDPSGAAVKQLLAPVFLQEIETFPVTGEEVIKRSAELEEEYHAQIKPRAVNLFLLHRGNRHPIEPGEHGFFLRGSRQRHTRDELLAIADTEPERFSPNVLLRPVCQDFLLPTAMYVAGPAEVSYFAQLQPAYDHFQVPMPVVLPRASLTLVDPRIGRIFARYGLPYEAMFGTIEEACLTVLRSTKADGGFDFAGMRDAALSALAGLPALAAEEDRNLAAPAENTLKNIERALQTFEERLGQSRSQGDAVMTTQIGKLLAWLAPGGKPQERVFCLPSFIARYGPGLVTTISDACQPFPAEHRLVNL